MKAGYNTITESYGVKYTELLQVDLLIFLYAITVDSLYHLFEGVSKLMVQI